MLKGNRGRALAQIGLAVALAGATGCAGLKAKLGGKSGGGASQEGEGLSYRQREEVLPAFDRALASAKADYADQQDDWWRRQKKERIERRFADMQGQIDALHQSDPQGMAGRKDELADLRPKFFARWEQAQGTVSGESLEGLAKFDQDLKQLQGEFAQSAERTILDPGDPRYSRFYTPLSRLDTQLAACEHPDPAELEQRRQALKELKQSIEARREEDRERLAKLDRAWLSWSPSAPPVTPSGDLKRDLEAYRPALKKRIAAAKKAREARIYAAKWDPKRDSADTKEIDAYLADPASSLKLHLNTYEAEPEALSQDKLREEILAGGRATRRLGDSVETHDALLAYFETLEGVETPAWLTRSRAHQAELAQRWESAYERQVAKERLPDPAPASAEAKQIVARVLAAEDEQKWGWIPSRVGHRVVKVVVTTKPERRKGTTVVREELGRTNIGGGKVQVKYRDRKVPYDYDECLAYVATAATPKAEAKHTLVAGRLRVTKVWIRRHRLSKAYPKKVFVPVEGVDQFVMLEKNLPK